MSAAADAEVPGRPGAPQFSADTGGRQLRSVFREFVSGITVVTTAVGHTQHAMTANAFCSISLEPALVMVSVARSARFHAAITQPGSRGWGVSILAADQAALAAHFARSGRDLATQFDTVDHELGERTGAALLVGSQAWLECRTHDLTEAGDHTIVIGEVLAGGVNSAAGLPLTYHRGGYALPLPD
ncbi:MAG TPA: flavin reductase family protein [Candidatus Avipropionibacterium avicola]|uniref:Flavin reductase family protein n=1 Tax=Candidatus Avipropionibacterium avicola TaxID=2840701 RepID=A0A9D1GWS9_9ACTN|nr:flavin reductase family protein [Candidatus Avipropionibacterium avicola]